MLFHITLTLILCVLNLIPVAPSIRRKVILPISFLAIGLFMGFRYDYGLDYWNYYDLFYYPNTRKGDDEFLFWFFFDLFDKYYVYILVKSMLLAGMLYYLVRKYVPTKYYWLFIIIFMANSSLLFTMITAERTCMGAMVLWMGLEFFYFRKKNLVLLTITILVACLFHTILLTMLIIPIVDILFGKYLRNEKILIGLLLFFLLIGGTVTPILFKSTVEEVDVFAKYDYYSDGSRFTSSNYFGILLKALLLFTAYYIIKPIKYLDKGDVYYKFVLLSICYLMVYFLGVETDGRIGMILIPFLVIAMLQRIPQMNNKLSVLTMVLPFVFVTLFGLYTLYSRMIIEPWLPGNYLTYQTIFEESFFE